MNKVPPNLLEAYDQNLPLFKRFATDVVNLLQKLLHEEAAAVHSVTGRVKEKLSLKIKISRPSISRTSRKYNNINDVTDIVGVRLITYFANDVDRIASIIRREFNVDWENSVDKRALLDPDRFGYMSLHYVVGISRNRLRLPEYAEYRNLKFEIQIRSILQHSWAEIEHDLGYKSEMAVPSELRRAFSRVAGLLELADAEFDRIRDSMNIYRQEVVARITSSPSAVTIDRDSLIEFAENSELVKSIDAKMLAAVGLNEISGDAWWVGDYVEHLAYFEISNFRELEEALRSQRELLIIYSRERLSTQNYVRLIRGVCITYLSFGLAARSLKSESVVAYFEEFNQYSGRESERVPIANLLVDIVRRVQESNQR